MNAQQWIAAMTGTVTLFAMAGGALLWAADDRYMLREESAQMVVRNKCETFRSENEWLETLAQGRALSRDELARLTWLKRRIADPECNR
jgi:hypothetical protein